MGIQVVAGDLLKIESTDQLVDTEIDDKTPKDYNRNIVIADENNINSASIHDIVIPVIGAGKSYAKE